MDRGRDYCFHQFGAGGFGDGEGRWCRRCVATRGRNLSFFPSPNFIHPASDADDSLLARDGWMAVCVNQLVSGTLNLPLHYLQNKAVISTSLSLKQENNRRRERR